jgi:hypothetical protein
MACAVGSLTLGSASKIILLSGTQEFELPDDEVRVRIKVPFKSEELPVPLAVLTPEPEIDSGILNFQSRVKCGPLLTLYLNNPNTAEFNAFVDAVKKKARKELNTFTGIE